MKGESESAQFRNKSFEGVPGLVALPGVRCLNTRLIWASVGGTKAHAGLYVCGVEEDVEEDEVDPSRDEGKSSREDATEDAREAEVAIGGGKNMSRNISALSALEDMRPNVPSSFCTVNVGTLDLHPSEASPDTNFAAFHISVELLSMLEIQSYQCFVFCVLIDVP
jgi:hypothetical protein